MDSRTLLASALLGLSCAMVACGDDDDASGDAGASSGIASSGSGPGSSGSSTGGGGPIISPDIVKCEHVGSGTDYTVGPGQAYASIGDVPFETLVAGDTVRIFHREEPYREKIMIAGAGTAEEPIRVCGVLGSGGEQPVIDGDGATTRPQLGFPYDGHQPRGVVMVGHPGSSVQPYDYQPQHIVIEALAIRHGHPDYSFTDKSGQTQPYGEPAAGIFVQRGDHITIRGCTITENSNGLFLGSSGGPESTRDVLVEANHIFENGGRIEAYHHNVYNEAQGITFQFNYFGRPHEQDGIVYAANIKERSSGVVIRYNWILDGGHLIDLVDAQEAVETTVPDPAFHSSHVYGNVLIMGPVMMGSMVHYGGDSGMTQNYRKGTLYFYNNTVVIHSDSYADYDIAAMFELSTNEEHLDARNNVFYSTSAPTPVKPIVMLGPRDDLTAGIASFSSNWVTNGWTPYEQIPGVSADIQAEVTGFDGSILGTDPGFAALADEEFAPSAGSPLVAAGAALSDDYVPAALQIGSQYVRHQKGAPRRDGNPPTLGAFGP